MKQRSACHVIMGIWVLVFAVEAWFCCCFGCLDQERTALLDLEKSFNATRSYYLPSWIAGTDCCHWEGVNCSSVTGRVIELSLEDMGSNDDWYLNASLLLPLKELKKLNVRGNHMRGFTDSEAFERWSKMTELEDLEMSWNNLNETILSFVCALKSLKHLQIRGNMSEFGGSLPTAAFERCSKMTELEDLDMSWNQLNETILPFLCALKSLKNLQIRDNEFRGSRHMAKLFTCLRGLEGLEGLDLSHGVFYYSKNYTEPIPSSIESMTSLQALGLAQNGLGDSHSIQGLCKLKNLQELDLSDNEFEGEIPFCLRNLTNLHLLDLSGNRFSGNIPTSIISSLRSLEFLSLANNQFSGILKLSSFAHLSNLKGIELGGNDYLEVQTEHPLLVSTFQLEFLDLSNCNINKLSSAIPSFLLTQQNLTYLDLSHNNLMGNVPVWLLENNTRLELVILRNNSFTGTFHLSYHINDTKLLALDISNNQVNGTLPANLGSLLPSLELLNMSRNELQGRIPPSIGDMRSLSYLDLSHNNISGEIPELLFARCVNLELLQLSNNSLYGKIFPASSNLTNLELLYLDSNNFTGSFSPSLLNSSSLGTINVGDNHMSGDLPSLIGELPYLRGLILQGNHFEGPIPAEFCKLKELFFLDLSKNNFNGSIPSCLNTSSLKYIHLDNNLFSGHIPSALLEVSSLVTLDLRNNHINGVIPTLIGNCLNLRVLLLRGNHLHGTIPFELCKLKNISMLDLSHNDLFGSIPSCISNLAFGSLANLSQDNLFQLDGGFFAHYDHGDFLWESATSRFFVSDVQQEVEFITKSRANSYKGYILNYVSGIDLSCNQLTGEIPIEMGHLSSLYSLNLSYNQLTGWIPTTLSNLMKIECLDLSYNRLNGTIPIELTKLNFLSSFTVAHNNLSGSTPNMVFQFATFNEGSYEGNPLLCGPPLKNSCTSPTPTNTIQSHGVKDDNDGHLVTFYGSFLGSYCVFLLGTIVVLHFSNQRRAVCFLHSVDSWCALHLYKICKLFCCK